MTDATTTQADRPNSVPVWPLLDTNGGLVTWMMSKDIDGNLSVSDLVAIGKAAEAAPQIAAVLAAAEAAFSAIAARDANK